MSTDQLNDLMAGAISFGQLAAGLFFWKFFRKTKDRLFAIFAAAFWLMGVNRAALALLAADETRTYFYIVRLLVFLLILIAVLDKNRARKQK
jgi:hypothetical protein